FLVESVSGTDEGDDAARLDEAQRSGKEVIVDRSLKETFPNTRVCRRVIGERDVRDHEVEVIFRQRRLFTRLDEDRGLRIKPREDAACERIDFDSHTFGIRSQRLGHRAEKMADASGRFKNPKLRLSR